jgi:LysM repeat protein
VSPAAPARTVTTTPLPVASICPQPAGWSTITVRSGDTLDSLAGRYNTTPELLARANCLVGTTLFPGSQLYVPAPPPVQPTIPCGPPSGWVLGYSVAQGDTLYHISQMFGVSVYQLQLANCMLYSTLIHPGQRLYVPYVPTNTPIPPTLTPIPPSETPTTAPTETATQPPTEPPTPLPEPTTLTPEPTTVTPEPTAVTPEPTPETPAVTIITEEPEPTTPDPGTGILPPGGNQTPRPSVAITFTGTPPPPADTLPPP